MMRGHQRLVWLYILQAVWTAPDRHGYNTMIQCNEGTTRVTVQALYSHESPLNRFRTDQGPYHANLHKWKGSHTITFLWLWPASDHEPHCRHAPTNTTWRRTESTPRCGWWYSHMTGIYSNCSTREMNEQSRERRGRSADVHWRLIYRLPKWRDEANGFRYQQQQPEMLSHRRWKGTCDGRSVTDWLTDLTWLKTGHFRDVLPSQSLDVVLKKLNLTQQKQTTQEQNSLS